jgi:hypothetical protein
MQKVDVVPQPRGLASAGSRRRSLAAIPWESPVPTVTGERPIPGLSGRSRALLSRLSDVQLALAIGAVLFVVCGYPLALVEVPPLQDLPNHLAAVTIINHPEQYPEFVSNGFLKTNAALFTWLYFVGKLVGVNVAAKMFALLVIAANAIVLPQFVLRFTGSRKKLVIASFFLWPMIHNWFVSMGMLDFALGVPLSLVVLMLLDKQRTKPTLKNGLLIALATVCTWYAHVFALLAVNLLVTLHVAQVAANAPGESAWKARIEEAKKLFLFQIPSILLMLFSVFQHVTEPVGQMTGYVDSGDLLPPWELLYNAWSEWFYGFTWLSIGSIVAAVGLAIILWLRRKEAPTFFSPLAVGVLITLFVFSPYIATNWFHFNSRFIPFIWFAALVRVPERLDKRVLGLLGFCGATYVAAMGIDYVRLDRDRAEFTAGMSAVPEGARLLPLIFNPKLTSENTRSLLHAWGFYVTERQTSAPLLFSHSRSFPVMYRKPPPVRFNHLVLEGFAPNMNSPNWVCDVLRNGGVAETDCVGTWRREWRDFWDDARSRFDHVLMWEASPEARALVPPDYRLKFHQGRLAIYERIDATASR